MLTCSRFVFLCSCVQVMTFAQAEAAKENPFDLTKTVSAQRTIGPSHVVYDLSTAAPRSVRAPLSFDLTTSVVTTLLNS